MVPSAFFTLLVLVLGFLVMVMEFTVGLIVIQPLIDLFLFFSNNLISLDRHLLLMFVDLLGFTLFFMAMLQVIIGNQTVQILAQNLLAVLSVLVLVLYWELLLALLGHQPVGM